MEQKSNSENILANMHQVKNIAIDGKWLNGSDVNGQYTALKEKIYIEALKVAYKKVGELECA